MPSTDEYKYFQAQFPIFLAKYWEKKGGSRLLHPTLSYHSRLSAAPYCS